MSKDRRINPSEINNDNFENELFKALNYYGFSFPITRDDIDRYELLKGETEVALPESLQDFDVFYSRINEKNENKNIRFSIAAREGEFLSKDIVDKMQQLMDESEKNQFEKNED